MKISNYKTVKLFIYIITILVFINIITGIIIFFLKILKEEIIFSSTALIILILILLFMNLRALIFENSGEVVTIKMFHPLENIIYAPGIEFPANQFKDFEVKKTFGGYIITLKVENLKKRAISRKFPLIGFSLKQINDLMKLLDQIKLVNLNTNIENLSYDSEG